MEALRPLFTFRATRAALEQQLGPPHARDLDSNGMGLVDEWRLRFPCGLEIFLWLFHIRPDGSLVERGELGFVEVQSRARDEKHIRFHVPVPLVDVSYWGSGVLVDEPLAWCVRRQDDNGNREEVGRFTSRCEAESVAQSLESRGHKQTYWVERV